MDSLMFTSTYERRLVEAQERLDKAKSEVAFFKLQIKQEKRQHRWASSNPEIKALLKQHPTMRCENGAGLTYLSIDVSVLDTFEVPEGWQLFETSRRSDSLGAPVCSIYHKTHFPANLYVTKHVR